MENPIKSLRILSKMSQVEFARTIETTQSTISKWEKNMRFPERKNFILIMKLAKKFHLEAEILKYFCKKTIKEKN